MPPTMKADKPARIKCLLRITITKISLLLLKSVRGLDYTGQGTKRVILNVLNSSKMRESRIILGWVEINAGVYLLKI